MRVAYLGNFSAPHSTENHIARAWEHNGHHVWRCQEDDPSVWAALAAGDTWGPDMVLWTRTKSLTPPPEVALRTMLGLHRRKIPLVGVHLDIWWGLKREMEIFEDPYFQCDILITADGGHDEQWAKAGVNHVWMPPGISLAEAEIGAPRDDYRSPIAFAGSHDGGYHPEHQHRHELVAWLKQNFRRDCAFWPRPGEHAVRGKDLQDLYASVDVVIGDSCFAGTGLANYWSDRIPETLGRGGFLLHPHVPGLDAHFAYGDHLIAWLANDWEGLGQKIQWALDNPGARRDIAVAGRIHTRAHHTYERRVQQVVELLRERGMISA